MRGLRRVAHAPPWPAAHVPLACSAAVDLHIDAQLGLFLLFALLTGFQVGVFLLYASPRGATFLDRSLYLPEEWAHDTPRRAQAGPGVRHARRRQPAAGNGGRRRP